ncbi:benzoylformate decarboxylase [Tsukamurella ocularis]|uniref:benzoylformate decarboxylase n=1 Tax=Tsukamurella ocularis TaxID=1970234 RepID=UPI0039F13073
MNRTVREIVHQLLQDRGITHVFGNPGSTEMRFFRDFPADLRYVVGLQEASVIAMADGHARATGGVGLAMVHSASGLGHGLGSLFTAARNGTPLVVLAGQQTRSLLPHAPYLQAQDAAAFPRPHVKDAIEPARAADVPELLAQAIDLAAAPPAGPVFVSVPEDDWDEPGGEVAPRRAARGLLLPADSALAELVDDLTGAHHPALVLGGAVEAGGGRGAAVALARSLGAAVYAAPLTDRAAFPEDDPHFAGFLPPFAEGVRAALDGHDVVLVAGAPVFTFHVPSDGPVIRPGTRLWHVTDDPGDASRALAGTSLLAPPASTVGVLARLTAAAGTVPLRAPSGRTRDDAAAPPAAGTLSPEAALAAIAAVLPDDARIVEEAPTHRNAMHAHLPIRSGQDFHVAASGGLGWGMPAAVGIALADPDRPVVCVIGDGSSLYSVQALWTAAQHGAGVLFAVLDNGGYAAMKAFGGRLGVPDAPGLDLPGVDPTALARGFGVGAATAGTPDEVRSIAATAIAGRRPFLLRIPVGPAAGALY